VKPCGPFRRKKMSYIRVDDLSKQYGEGEAAVLAVRGINFGIASGELIAIMGESESGKSTDRKSVV
jgi:ABC-type antimicrobial peptide transport system, ATPase component